MLHLRDKSGVGTSLDRPLSDMFRNGPHSFDSRDRCEKRDIRI